MEIEKNPMKRYLLIVAGTIALGLGFLGVFMPLLPTTPFLLITAYCYMRSSSRLYHWLIEHQIFGAYIYNYITYRAVRKSTKKGILIFLWITLAVSFIAINILHARLFLIAVGIGVTTHIHMLKSMPDEEFVQKADRLHDPKKPSSFS